MDFYPVKPAPGGKPLGAAYTHLACKPGWTVQAKMDGWRAVWDGSTLWTRTGNRITNAPNVVLSLEGLDRVVDGELVGGVFYAFDLADHEGTYRQRHADMMDALPWGEFVKPMPTGVDWADVVDNGWEGVVIKRWRSYYPKATRAGRTTSDWLKFRAAWL